jgi:cysteine desulfurase / selenocysteine lyase
MFDIARLREDTPATRQLIHFNNAGCSLTPAPVLDTVIEHLRLEAEIGGYEAAARAAGALERVYESAAKLFGCGADEIALVENATRAWDMFFYSLRFGPGDRILTSRAEYASNVLAYLQTTRRTGAELVLVPDDETGQISLEALAGMIDERVKLIAITHVPTQGGLVNPAAEVGRIARAAGVTYLLDTCQSVGQMRVDVNEIGCDALTATGRKFLRGPRGTGMLYVSRRVIDRLDPPFLDLFAARWTGEGEFQVRPDARRFECWESYKAGRLGLGAAIDYALRIGLGAIEERVTRLAARLREELAGLPGVRVHDRGARRCAIVTFTRDDMTSHAVAAALAERRINVSVSPIESARFDLAERGLTALVRASVHYYNTDEEIETFCRAVRSLG